MTKYLTCGLLVVGLAACGSGTAANVPQSAAADPSTATAATPIARREPAPVSAPEYSVPSGTPVDVTINEEISSRKYSAGHHISASITHDILDRSGRVIIPAGSPVDVEISAISPSNPGDTRGEGVIELTVASVTVNGHRHDQGARVSNVPHIMKGRGVTKGQGEDVAVGAAVGALAGQLLGKNTKSTVIGGAVGAVGGGAVAVAGAQRDVIVSAGTHISFSLPQALVAR